jgi:ABC-type Mn2+/Zn2+ transport system permease subunit
VICECCCNYCSICSRSSADKPNEKLYEKFSSSLFGNILGVTDQDLIMIVNAAITSLFAIFFHKRLLFTMLDKQTAKHRGEEDT